MRDIVPKLSKEWTYRIFSMVLLNRINPYIEKNMAEYQCGFKKGRSAIE